MSDFWWTTTYPPCPILHDPLPPKNRTSFMYVPLAYFILDMFIHISGNEAKSQKTMANNATTWWYFDSMGHRQEQINYRTGADHKNQFWLPKQLYLGSFSQPRTLSCQSSLWQPFWMSWARRIKHIHIFFIWAIFLHVLYKLWTWNCFTSSANQNKNNFRLANCRKHVDQRWINFKNLA